MCTKNFAFILLLFCLAACTPARPDPAMLPTPTALSSQARSPSDTPAPTASPSPGLPTVTDTAVPEPTATLTGGPQWFMRAEEVTEWPEDGSYPYWLDTHTISFRWIWEKNVSVIKIIENSIGPLEIPELPAFLKDVDQYDYVYSPNKTYVVVCGEQKDEGYYKLALYRTVDGQMIGHLENIVHACSWGIAWAEDESALSFYNAQYIDNGGEFYFDIYVWKTDGSMPYVIGKGNLGTPGQLSPDGKRLVLEIHTGLFEPGKEFSYQILYTDGRHQQQTKAFTQSNSEDRMRWLTNDIVYEHNTCCAGQIFWTYYVASTGEMLHDISWQNSFPATSYDTQGPILSPDQRWFIVDRTIQYEWDTSATSYDYTLYDLQAYQPYTLSTSTDTYLNFIGWSADSTQFIFIRRPITDTVAAQPDAPFGLLSLDPYTRQLTLLEPTLRDAWLSPDGNYLFGVSGISESDGMRYGAIYALDGSPLTPQQAITDQISPWDLQEFGERGNLRFTWSNDSTQVALRDDWGNAWLAGIDGQIRPLAANLPAESTDSKTYSSELFIWSPDDTHLLVRSGERAWVVYLP